MTLTRRQFLAIVLLLSILFMLPFVMLLIRKGQDIRSRAITGNANLLLSKDTVDVYVGNEFTVLVSIQLTDPTLRVSGADLTLLYDSSKLEVIDITPVVTATDAGAAFTDIIHTSSGGTFPDGRAFARVALVAQKANNALSGGTVQFARLRMRALASGQTRLEFPTENRYTEIVGINP